MTLPNDASVGLHRAMGFQLVGTYRRIGWKHGAWHDVMWMQRALVDDADAPTELQDEFASPPVVGSRLAVCSACDLAVAEESGQGERHDLQVEPE